MFLFPPPRYRCNFGNIWVVSCSADSLSDLHRLPTRIEMVPISIGSFPLMRTFSTQICALASIPWNIPDRRFVWLIGRVKDFNIAIEVNWFLCFRLGRWTVDMPDLKIEYIFYQYRRITAVSVDRNCDNFIVRPPAGFTIRNFIPNYDGSITPFNNMNDVASVLLQFHKQFADVIVRLYRSPCCGKVCLL